MVLTDFFTGTPFRVEIERDLSEQQQFLDVAIVRRGRGHFRGRLPDGLEDLVEHNLITFKSFHEALDAWAMRELIGHYVAYRKLVSPAPSELLPEARFRLYAVSARFPDNLTTQVPWQERQAGVYDCRWGVDVVRIVVAGRLPREPHNAPLQLFSASPELVGFARGAYERRSDQTSGLLDQLGEMFREEGLVMYTMEDFNRQYVKDRFARLSPEERRVILQSLPAEEQEQMLQLLPAERRLAGLSEEEIRKYLERLTARRPTGTRKPRRKR